MEPWSMFLAYKFDNSKTFQVFSKKFDLKCKYKSKLDTYIIRQIR